MQATVVVFSTWVCALLKYAVIWIKYNKLIELVLLGLKIIFKLRLDKYKVII